MKQVNIQAAKTHLSRLVEEALQGKRVIIGKAGKPMVELTPFSRPARDRAGGQFPSQIQEIPGCWEDDALGDALGESIYKIRRKPARRAAESRPS